ncbi:MAG: hypothetical protein KDD29_05245 [Flavobacteriales bacterium]|nr:hypothetical protein [Flavobacteriales bacterium]
MRKLLFIIALMLSISFTGYSQYYVDYGISAGASNYLGEMGGGAGTRRSGIADMKLDYTKWALGGFYRYRMSNRFAVKGFLNYIRISGDDSKTLNPARRARNLNFKNDMFELGANFEMYVYRVNDVGRTGRYSTDFNLYLFGGVAAFYSNPKGQKDSGEWVSLRPLQTEGVAYSTINFSIPAGLGFYYTINRKYRLGMEVGWRTTFTDYIDDASDKYISNYDGISNKTNQDVIDEVNLTLDPSEKPLSTKAFEIGDKRGDPEHNDSYLTATVNFSWAIRGRSKFYRSKHNWVLGKNKRRRRKSRAKF